MLTARSPGLSSAYGVSPSRPDYPITPRTYQTPRTDVHPAGRPPPPPPQAAEYQLPPLPRIRSPPAGSPSQHFEQPHAQQQQQQQPPPPPPQAYQTREERSRIGIGGLLEPPGPARSP
jgi:hypothetical protein